ncbi:MAG: IclR family transcriptional regulator [Fusobacteriaceae bacterium]
MKINRSVERSMEILKFISSRNEGVTLKEIISELDIPKSSAFDIVQTLIYTDMINVIEGVQNRYVIGLETFRIGLSYEKDMLKIAQKYLKQLSEKLNKTVFLGILKDGEVIYLDKREPSSPIVTTATLGSRNPVHCTALGKVMLFGLSEEKIKKILKEKGMASKTERTITDPDKFLDHLRLWRKKGYALDDREIEDNQLCMSAPIYDASGKIVAAISASGFYNPNENLEKSSEILKEITQKISKELGYSTIL